MLVRAVGTPLSTLPDTQANGLHTGQVSLGLRYVASRNVISHCKNGSDVVEDIIHSADEYVSLISIKSASGLAIYGEVSPMIRALLANDCTNVKSSDLGRTGQQFVVVLWAQLIFCGALAPDSASEMVRS